MQAVHVLVDLENNQPTLEDVQRLVPGVTHAWLFHSRSQVKRLASFAPLGAEQTPVPISRPGKNALDFHLAFYVGYIAARNPGARLVIVAIDRGYGPMIEHALTLGFDVVQVPFKPAAARVKKAVGKKTVARKAPTGKAPAKKVAVAKAPVARAPKGPVAKAAVPKAPTTKAPAAKPPIARTPIAKAPVATVSAAPAPAAKAPAKKAPAKKPPARKAATKKVNAATQPAARKAKAPGVAPPVAGKTAPAHMAAPARPQARPQTHAQPQPRPKLQPKPQTKPQPKSPSRQRAPGEPPAAEKVIANLRTMGEKRPKKLRQLRRYVSSMLGTGEADPAVGRLVDHLVANGTVRVSGEALAYGPERKAP